jgi:hypothetical protein
MKGRSKEEENKTSINPTIVFFLTYIKTTFESLLLVHIRFKLTPSGGPGTFTFCNFQKSDHGSVTMKKRLSDMEQLRGLWCEQPLTVSYNIHHTIE